MSKVKREKSLSMGEEPKTKPKFIVVKGDKKQETIDLKLPKRSVVRRIKSVKRDPFLSKFDKLLKRVNIKVNKQQRLVVKLQRQKDKLDKQFKKADKGFAKDTIKSNRRNLGNEIRRESQKLFTMDNQRNSLIRLNKGTNIKGKVVKFLEGISGKRGLGIIASEFISDIPL